jgi:ABC-type thiamine transport system ATPase subunit
MKTQPKGKSKQSPVEVYNREIIIAVMGQTGAGKSRFIQKITGFDYVVTGNSLKSGKYLLTQSGLDF